MEILDVMNATIAEPRSEVGATAPKMISFEIPIDKIGEVIGPKGKVINAIQAETGANIAVDDDGTVGVVSIGSPDKEKVEEAERQIKLILNPPTAEVGQTYPGVVVNITKFGAFVNILPGRDGLVHISKMGGGRRIERVEDVLELGQALEVKVDDVDPNGKVSLTPVTPLGGDGEGSGSSNGGSSGGGSRDRGDRGGRSDRGDRGGRSDRGDRGDRGSRSDSGSSKPKEDVVSFEDSFDAEVREEFGDLGPASEAPREGGDGGGGRRGGGRGRR